MPDELQRQRVAERRIRVLTLLAAGFRHDQISDQLTKDGYEGIGTPELVAQDARRALEDLRMLRDHHMEFIVDLELERLGSIQRTVESVLRTAQANQDEPTLVLSASAQLLRISKRRSTLLTLDGKDAQRPPAEDELERVRRRRMEKEAAG
jgi:hypothetical protein